MPDESANAGGGEDAWAGAVHHFRAGVPLTSAAVPASDVELAFAFDDRLVEHLPTTLRSITTHTRSRLRLTLLTRGVDATTIAAISREHADAAVTWCPAEALDFGPLQLLPHTTISTMDRLFLPAVMPWASRVVHLDVDVAVAADIRELFDTDLAGQPLAARASVLPAWRTGAAVLELVARGLDEPTAHRLRTEVESRGGAEFPCFNAGVLVLDLDRLRALSFTAETCRLAREYGLHDQHAMNLFFRGRFAPLDAAWNHFPTQEDVAAPKIVHYVGPRKPWLAGGCLKDDLWLRHRTAPS